MLSLPRETDYMKQLVIRNCAIPIIFDNLCSTLFLSTTYYIDRLHIVAYSLETLCQINAQKKKQQIVFELDNIPNRISTYTTVSQQSATLQTD